MKYLGSAPRTLCGQRARIWEWDKTGFDSCLHYYYLWNLTFQSLLFSSHKVSINTVHSVTSCEPQGDKVKIMLMIIMKNIHWALTMYKCFTQITLFDLSNEPGGGYTIIIPFYGWGNGGMEGLSNLGQGQRGLNGGARIHSWADHSWSHNQNC